MILKGSFNKPGIEEIFLDIFYCIYKLLWKNIWGILLKKKIKTPYRLWKHQVEGHRKIGMSKTAIELFFHP